MRKENGVAAQIGATSRDFNGWTGGSSAHLRLVPLFWDKLVYENEAARCLGKDISCRAPKRQGLRGFGAIQIIWSANFATSTFRTKNGCRQRRQLTSLWRDGPTSAGYPDCTQAAKDRKTRPPAQVRPGGVPPKTETFRTKFSYNVCGACNTFIRLGAWVTATRVDVPDGHFLRRWHDFYHYDGCPPPVSPSPVR